MDPVESAIREAELAHELEELKVKVDEYSRLIHTARNRMQVLTLRLASIRRGHGDPA